jgi:hypothetical protein
MPGESYLVARPLADVIATQKRPWQLGATLFVAFGVLAAVVAAIGLYGAAAYNVARRTHEFGVRVALGADRARLIRLVLGQSLRLTGAGILLGLMMSAAAGRWIAPFCSGSRRTIRSCTEASERASLRSPCSNPHCPLIGPRRPIPTPR